MRHCPPNRRRRPIVRVTFQGSAKRFSRERRRRLPSATPFNLRRPINPMPPIRPMPLSIRHPALTRRHSLPPWHRRQDCCKRNAKRSAAAGRGRPEAAPSESVAVATPDDQSPPAQPAADAPPTEPVATGPSIDQVPPAETAPTPPAPLKTAAVPAAPSTAAVQQQDTARKVAARKRLAAVRRVRRTRPTAVAQSAAPNSVFPQPGFQSAPQAVGGPFVRPPAVKRGQN